MTDIDYLSVCHSIKYVLTAKSLQVGQLFSSASTVAMFPVHAGTPDLLCFCQPRRAALTPAATWRSGQGTAQTVVSSAVFFMSLAERREWGTG